MCKVMVEADHLSQHKDVFVQVAKGMAARTSGVTYISTGDTPFARFECDSMDVAQEFIKANSHMTHRPMRIVEAK